MTPPDVEQSDDVTQEQAALTVAFDYGMATTHSMLRSVEQLDEAVRRCRPIVDALIQEGRLDLADDLRELARRAYATVAAPRDEIEGTAREVHGKVLGP